MAAEWHGTGELTMLIVGLILSLFLLFNSVGSLILPRRFENMITITYWQNSKKINFKISWWHQTLSITKKNWKRKSAIRLKLERCFLKVCFNLRTLIDKSERLICICLYLWGKVNHTSRNKECQKSAMLSCQAAVLYTHLPC